MPASKQNRIAVVLGGPNGAGKTTAAPALLSEYFQIPEFVNADVLAEGLSGFAPEGSALAAGRIMLGRLMDLAARGVDFAFESTLASRGLAAWLGEIRRSGYAIHIVYLWLPDADLAVARVRQRVRDGGHSVSEDVIRRRYRRGLGNLSSLYLPLADRWRIYDNSTVGGPRLIADGGSDGMATILDSKSWATIIRG